MYLQQTPYTIPVLMVTIITGVLALLSWRRRPATGTATFTLLMLAVMEWAFASTLELGALELQVKMLWTKVQYLGIVTVPLMWFLFALQYTGREKWLTQRTLALLLISPLITLLLAWTNEQHGLMWSHTELDTSASFPMLSVVHGAWFWIHSAFSYLLILAGTVLLIQSYIRSPQLYRGQAGTLLIGLLAPWISNGLYIFGLNPFPHLDLTPFGFAISGLAASWSLFRFQMFDIVPVARDMVMDQMSDAMVVLDAQARIVDINPAGRHLVEYSGGKIIGQPVSQVLPELADQVDVPEMHTNIVLGEGEARRYFDIHVSVLKNRRGLANGKVIVLHDTTRLKETELDLRDTQAILKRQNAELSKFLQAVEHSANIVVITDLDGKIEYVNAKFEEVTGYTFDEVLGQNPRILRSNTEDADFYRELWQTIVSGHEWHGEFYNRRKDDTFYWEEAAIAPIFNAQGQMTHFIAIKEDITARKEAEEARREYADKLEARNAELDAFSHTVAHDLKNPLAAMIGFSGILQTKRSQLSEEKQHKFLHQIEQTGFRMQSIIDELLLLANVREVSEVGLRPLDMGSIIAQAQRRVEFLVEEYEVDITLPERWPAARGYAPWVEEVWVNYLSNAVKYGGRPPRIELGATVVEEGWVRYWVRDNGKGLSPEEQTRLFTPFERLHQVNVDGHGLGLSIVRRIVEKLNGTVGVESAVGQGSEFYFMLPGVETDRAVSNTGSEVEESSSHEQDFGSDQR